MSAKFMPESQLFDRYQRLEALLTETPLDHPLYALTSRRMRLAKRNWQAAVRRRYPHWEAMAPNLF